jgi:hypothetical protein
MSEIDQYKEEKGNLRPFAINSILHLKFGEMMGEFEYNTGYFSEFMESYPIMKSFAIQLESQGRQFPDILEKYLKRKAEIDDRYGSYFDKTSEMKGKEAAERVRIISDFAGDLGIIRIDRRETNDVRHIDFHYRSDGRVLLDSVFQKRLSENRNLNLLITGKVGGGKSYAGLSIGHFIDPKFTLNNVVFSVTDLYKLLDKNPPEPGSVVLLDEAGIDASNLESMSTTSKALGTLLQTTRYLKLCMILTVPNVNFIVKQSRLLADFLLKHEEGQEVGEFSILEPMESEDSKDVEFIPYRTQNRNGREQIIESVSFPLPPAFLTNEYEGIRKSVMESVRAKETSKLQKKFDAEDGRGKNINSLKNLRNVNKKYKGGD